jgi:hypothetical protein
MGGSVLDRPRRNTGCTFRQPKKEHLMFCHVSDRRERSDNALLGNDVGRFNLLAEAV